MRSTFRALFGVSLLLQMLGGVARAQTATTGTATGVTDIAATLSGTQPWVFSGVYTYFQWGTTTSYGSSVDASYVGIDDSGQYIMSAQPPGLQPSTLYHYRILLANYNTFPTTFVYGQDLTFTTSAPATPPTPSPVGTDLTYATNTRMYASVASGSSPTTLSFEYGTTTSYGSSVDYPSTIPTNTTSGGLVTVTGLTPGTLYHCRCKAVNAEGTSFSTDTTFTTPGVPTLTMGAPTGITDLSAVLHGTAAANGGFYLLFLQVGTTTSYGTNYGPDPGYVSYRDNATLTIPIAGLLPNTTYHYRLAASDDATPMTYYYGTDQTFTTGAPATPPTLGNISAYAVTYKSTYLEADNVYSGSSPATVVFEYGTSTAYGTTVNADSTVPANSTAYPMVYIAGLASATTYHFRCKVTNGEGSVTSPDITFTTANGPSLVTGAATGVTDVAAALNGTVNTAGLTLDVSFEYGLTTSYGSSLNASPYELQNNADAPVSAYPPGLLPSTTYHYRLKAVDYYHPDAVFYGPDATFTTSAASSPPYAGTISVQYLAQTTATVQCYPVWSGSSPATVVFDYGPTTAYGSSITADPLSTNVGGASQVNLTGLSMLTTYHVRCRITNSEGSATSADATFTTLGNPVVTTDPVTNLGDLSATLHGSINPNGPSTTATVSFEFGTTTNYGTTLSATQGSILSSSLTPFTGAATGLLPNTTYHYRSKVFYSFTNGTFYGPDVAFTTGTPATPPTVGSVFTNLVSSSFAAVETFTVTAGSSDATVIWEYGTTTAYGSFVSSDPTIIPVSTSNTASALIYGLTPNTTYHYRCTATNAQGATSSADATFTTGTAPVLTTSPLFTATDLTATLNGSAVLNGTTINSYNFEWGTTTSYGSLGFVSSITGGANNTPVLISGTVTGALPSTTYHFRLRGLSLNDNTYYYGEDQTFTTGPPATPPTVSTGSAGNVSPTAMSLHIGSLQTGSSATTLSFEYGLDTSYGNGAVYPSQLPPGQSYPSFTFPFNPNTTPSVAVTGLTPGTTYHYRAKAANNEGTAYGADVSFVTPALPIVTTTTASNITTVSATLNGTYQAQGVFYTAAFDYGPTTAYGSSVASSNLFLVIGGGGGGIIIGGGGNQPSPATGYLTDQLPGAAVHYRLTITDSSGDTYYGADQTFTMLTPTALAQNWRQQYFGIPDNSGSAADAASPAGDGIPNLLKYALDLDPTANSTNAMPQPVLKDYGGATYLSYTFQRDVTKTDLTYEVQAADSPAGPWTTIASSVGGAATTGPGFVFDSPYLTIFGFNPLCTVEVHDTVSTAEATRRFLRLQITR